MREHLALPATFFHPIAVELGILQKLSTLIEKEVNRRLDEKFDIRIKEEFHRQTMNVIELIEREWPADQLGERNDQKIKQLRTKVEANPRQAFGENGSCIEEVVNIVKTHLW